MNDKLIRIGDRIAAFTEKPTTPEPEASVPIYGEETYAQLTTHALRSVLVSARVAMVMNGRNERLLRLEGKIVRELTRRADRGDTGAADELATSRSAAEGGETPPTA